MITLLRKQNRLVYLGLLLTLAIFMASCTVVDEFSGINPLSQVSPLSPLAPLSVSATPDADKGAMIGRVVTNISSPPRPLGQTGIRLAEVVFWEEDKTNGTFVLEGATSPGTITREDGSFEISDLKPGDYVIVVGEVIGFNEIILESEGIAKVFTVSPGEVLNVGVLEVSLR